jgi:proteic killer suppression protein
MLERERKGQCSIWINDQYRVCFRWVEEENAAYDVEITDYH